MWNSVDRLRLLVAWSMAVVIAPLQACGGGDGGPSPAAPRNRPPTITITSPSDFEIFSLGETVRIAADAVDPDGTVDSVTFLVDGEVLGRVRQPPFEISWETEDVEGLRHRVVAEAIDDGGNRARDEVRIETHWTYQVPMKTSDGWETTAASLVGLDTDRLVRLVNTLRDTPNHMVHGIVIVRRGKLVFEKYFDGLSHPTWGETPVSYNRETLHVMSSCAKSVTSALLGIAIDRGLIPNVDATVFSFYPDLADLNQGRRQQLNLRNLISMSSGLSWNESTMPLTDPRNDLARFIHLALNTNSDLVRFVLGRPMVSDPGSRWVYGGGNTNVVGNIVQRASGMRLDQFAMRFLTEPLGIDQQWWWVLRPDFVYASGDVALRPRDAAKLGQLFLQEGDWNGVQVVSRDWVALSTTRHFPVSNRGSSGYGLGWWTKSNVYGKGAFAAHGWGGQAIIVMPEYEMVVVLTGGYYWTAPPLNDHELMKDHILPAVM